MSKTIDNELPLRTLDNQTLYSLIDQRVQDDIGTAIDDALNDITDLKVNGTLTIPTGAVDGYVLTSNADGDASWQDASVDEVADLKVNGTLTIPTGAVDGYVLTSNADGDAIWTDSTSSAINIIDVNPTNFESLSFSNDNQYRWEEGTYTLTGTLLIEQGQHHSLGVVAFEGDFSPMIQFGSASRIYEGNWSGKWVVVSQSTNDAVHFRNVANNSISGIRVNGVGTTAFKLNSQASERVSYTDFSFLRINGAFIYGLWLRPDGGFTNSNTFRNCRLNGSDQTTISCVKLGENGITLTASVNENRFMSCTLEGTTQYAFEFNNNARSNTIVGCRIELNTGVAPWDAPQRYFFNSSDAEFSSKNMIFDAYAILNSGVSLGNIDTTGVLAKTASGNVSSGVFMFPDRVRMYGDTFNNVASTPYVHVQRMGANSDGNVFTNNDNPVMRIDDSYANSGESDVLHLRTGRPATSSRFIHCRLRNSDGTNGAEQFSVDRQQVKIVDGSVSVPAYSFISNPDTGLFLDDGLSFTIDGSKAMEVKNEVIAIGQNSLTQRNIVGIPDVSGDFVETSIPYALSVQSRQANHGYSGNHVWMEMLGPNSNADEGCFFGLNDDDFQLWSYQGGDIAFYTSDSNPPSATNGSVKLRITAGNLAAGGGQLQAQDGNSTYPTYGFASDTNTGFYKDSSGNLSLCKDGVDVYKITSTAASAINGLLALDSIRPADGENYLKFESTTGVPRFLRFRRGGSGVNRCGAVFSSFDSSHFYLHNIGAEFRIAYSPTLTTEPLDNYLAINENGSVKVKQGTSGIPSYTFQGDTATGMYSEGEGLLGFSTEGVLKMCVRQENVSTCVPINPIDNGDENFPNVGISEIKGGVADTGLYGGVQNEFNLVSSGEVMLKGKKVKLADNSRVAEYRFTSEDSRLYDVVQRNDFTEFGGPLTQSAVFPDAGGVSVRGLVILNGSSQYLVGTQSDVLSLMDGTDWSIGLMFNPVSITSGNGIYIIRNTSDSDYVKLEFTASGVVQCTIAINSSIILQATFSGFSILRWRHLVIQADSSAGGTTGDERIKFYVDKVLTTPSYSVGSASTTFSGFSASADEHRIGNDGTNFCFMYIGNYTLSTAVWSSRDVGDLYEGIVDSLGTDSALTAYYPLRFDLIEDADVSNVPVSINGSNSGLLYDSGIAIVDIGTKVATFDTSGIELLGGSSIVNGAGEEIEFSSSTDSINFKTEGTDRLSLVGSTSITTTLPLRGINGSLGSPAYSFTSSTNSGLYYDNNLTFSVNGTNELVLNGVSATFNRDIVIPNAGSLSNGDGENIVFSTSSVSLQTGGISRVAINSTSTTSSVPFHAIDGGEGTPSYSFTNATDQGMYSLDSNRLGFSSGGTRYLIIDQTPAITSTTSADTSIYLTGRSKCVDATSATTSDAYHFHVESTGPAMSVYRRSISTTSALTAFRSDVGSTDSSVCIIRNNGDLENATGVYGTISDRRVKKEINEITGDQIDKIRQLKVYTYKLKGRDEPLVGIMADEVAELYPNFVRTSGESFRDSESGEVIENVQAVAGNKLVYPLIKSVQKLIEQVETLQTRGLELEARVSALEA